MAVQNGVVTTRGWLIEHLPHINLILSVAIVFFQRRDPKAVWTWLLVLYFIPIFGFVLYLIPCQGFRKSRMFRVKEAEDRLRYSVESQGEFLIGSREYSPDPISRDPEDLVMYNLETSGAVLTVDNTADVFTNGEERFTNLRREMEKATQHIHIQYYIIKDDEVFQPIVPILVKKVRGGVEVRILYDGMGGRFMPKCVWDQLRKGGIKIGESFPAFLGRLQFRVNYRNHRKIVVISGWVAHVGGFNVRKEYTSEDPKSGYWRDTRLKISGGAVYSLQIRFALDWNYATKENLLKDAKHFGLTDGVETLSPKAEMMFQSMACKVRQRPLGTQIITSGPGSNTRQIRDNYLELSHKAERTIHIRTPYFILDDVMLSALQIAARAGVDVRLMTPYKSDHPFAYWAAYSYVGDLLEAGARCYTYENGFLHAKGVMIDSAVCCYETVNMDIRSFELNFEVNVTIYDEEMTKWLEDTFLKDLENCHGVTESYCIRRSP